MQTKTEELEKSKKTYLCYSLDNELFAIKTSRVFNIIELVKITKVPKSPDYMKGVFNLRGKVLPVVDIRLKFQMSGISYTKDTCIVVINTKYEEEMVEIGILVDSVKSVLEINEEKILAPPDIGAKYKSKYIKGIINIDSQFCKIVNIDEVFFKN